MRFPGDVSKADGERNTEGSDMTSKMAVGSVEAPANQGDNVLGKQHNRNPGDGGS